MLVEENLTRKSQADAYNLGLRILLRIVICIFTNKLFFFLLLLLLFFSLSLTSMAELLYEYRAFDQLQPFS